MNIKVYVLGIVSFGIVIRMFIQIISFVQADDKLAAILLTIGLVCFIGFIAVIMKRLIADFKQGIPSEDERSKKVKLYSAGRAYFYSLYIWIALLAFHQHFDKDDILIFGLLGMIITLFLSWHFTKNERVLE
jgi:hypothetical protein